MAGGSSDYIPTNRTPEKVRERIQRAERDALKTEFGTELAGLLNQVLGKANNRDPETTQDRLETITQFVSDQLESSANTLFGGSVAKHTYVDGLSDVDTLLVLKPDVAAGNSPNELIQHVARLIENRLGTSANVETGSMAVTVKYPDGMELQLLPAQSLANGEVKIAAEDGQAWSKIAPRKFQEKLTQRNQECGNKLVPVIKLAKSVLSDLPQVQRLSGYHVESIAVSAFKDYTGQKTTRDMLVHFFEKAKTLVLDPIKDSTGQTINVDDYLGPRGSDARKQRSFMLERIEKRMRNAIVGQSLGIWKAILGIDEA